MSVALENHRQNNAGFLLVLLIGTCSNIEYWHNEKYYYTNEIEDTSRPSTSLVTDINTKNSKNFKIYLPFIAVVYLFIFKVIFFTIKYRLVLKDFH